jgi:hypothetical protein
LVDAISLRASAEGDADMGFLPRVFKPVLGVVVLLALTSLPTLRSERITGSVLTPQIAWAGGSPDETLKPPVEPPKKSAAIRPGTARIGSADESALRVSNTQRNRFTGIKRWEVYYRVFRIFAQRLI